jgi:hypothetical protein
MEHWRSDTDRRKPKYWEKHLSQLNSHMDWPGIELKPLQWEAGN